MHSALAIANWFVDAAKADGVRDLTPPKLHGLVYAAHGWLLGAAGKPMIVSPVKADRDGVFVPELRDAGCWGSRTVNEHVAQIKMDEARGVMSEHKPELAPDDPTVPALQWVWKTYGKLTAFQIAQHVREFGSPWDLIWNDEDRADDEAKLIPNTTIKLWFRDLSKMRQEQGRNAKLTDVQKQELKPKLEKTQRMLAKPDPDRLRQA
ncbi:MAG TPA: hypothetical protein VM369_01995 [Candidatus Binatia bacterium]|nr:hypothetical protein [Candidatus Binatia bacterium]